MIRQCGQADGATPLLLASQDGHVKVVSALLAAGANKDAAAVCFGAELSPQEA